jgi:autotransporter-associated beta strand protein
MPIATILRNLLPWLALALLAGAASVRANIPGGGTGTGPNVTVVNNGDGTVTLANGIISLVITTNNSFISKIYYTYNNSGTIVTTKVYDPNGYYFYGGFPLGSGQYTYSLAIDPASNGGDLADIRLTSNSATNGVQENHWSMRRGSPGFYVTATWTHRAQDGYNSPGVWGSVMPLSGNFNWLSVDPARNFFVGVEPTKSVPSYNNPHESTINLDGTFAGLYADKFLPGMDHCDLRAWGWSSVGAGGWNVGVWLTTQLEFSDGGPYKRDVSAYPSGDLNNSILTGEIGMGGDGTLAPGELWTKTMGPWFIYFNNVTNTLTTNAAAQALFTDALAQSDAEAGAWPYNWFTNNLTYGTYAQASGRGTVTGHLAINDSGNPNARSSGMWIGLMQQQNSINGNYDFQKWQKQYQFFVKADTNGNFTMPNVIAGANYTLWAFGPGAEGTFMSQYQTGGNPPFLFNVPTPQFSVTVTGGATNNLGTVTWTPTRVGATVFELGYPDRVAREFRHGEDYWSYGMPPKLGYPTPFWGMPMEFPSDFPNGMNYTVGQSRWTTDWNYDMPSLPDLGGNYQNCVGTLTFNLATAPTNGATGSIYFDCASDNYAAIIVSVNGNNLASTSGVTATPTALVSSGFSPPYQDDSDYHMSDHSSACDERITFPASLLHSGQNTITITMNGVGGTKFLMLDYLRLELTGYVPPAPAGVAAYAGNNCNLVSWPVTPGATSYNVLRSTTSGSGYAAITNGVAGPICGSGTNNAMYVDTTAANNTTYYYVVQSVNPTSTSANSAQSTGTMPLASLSSSAPAAPTGMTVTSSGHHNVALSWNASAGANFYSVYRTTLYTNFCGGTYPLRTIILNNTNTGTTYTDTSPTDGKIYSYYVTATSAGGMSGNSAASAPAIPVPEPPASAPGLAAGNFVNGTNVSLSWAPVAGAVGYDIYRSTQPGVFSYPGSLVRAIVETNYTDVGLATNQNYFYQIVAVNEGGISPAANVMVLLPPVALGLAAFPGNGQVTLNWSSQVGATNYLLEVSTTNGGPYTVLLNTTNNTYVNTGLTNGTTYYYIVYSQGPNGQSPVSAQASATPTAVIGSGIFWTNTITASTQNWNVNANWNNAAAFPNGATAVAMVNAPIGDDQTINLNQGITIGGLCLGAGGGAFTIVGNGGTLAFNNSTSSAWLTESPASSGDTINAPVTVTSSLLITNSSVNSLALAGNISSAPGGITINGNVVLSGTNTYSGGTVINAGNINFATVSAIPSSGAVTLNGTAAATSAGTFPNLVVNGNNSLTSGNISALTLNHGTLTLLYNGLVTYGGTISGTGRIVLGGAATFSRFTGSLGAANVIFDLGTNAGSLYERNNNTAVVMGGLVGGPNTQLVGDCNAGDHPMTYTIGGANVDTEFDGMITNGYSGSAAVTKTGTAKLILGGNNPYTGATTINQGSLIGVVGGNCSNSAVTVATTSGKTATLGISITNNSKQWTCASLTVNNGGASSELDFNFGTVSPSMTTAPLKVLGAVTFTTTPVVAVDSSGSPLAEGGQYPLMTWGSISGPVPTNVTMKARGASGHLMASGSTLYLVIDSVVNVEPLRWAASPAGVWDTSSINWVDNLGDPTVFYATGDQVLFDDTYVTNDVTVTLNSAVTPVNVKAANSVYNYTFTGTGAIGGTGGLSKSGTGVVTLGTTNSFTGGATVNGGTLTLDFSDPNAPATNIIPSANALTLGGGRLNVKGGVGETNTQILSGTTLNPGASSVTVTPNGGGSVVATLGAFSGGNNPTTGASVVFNGPATVGSNNVVVPATGIITTTTAGIATASGSMGKNAGSGGTGNAWATVGLYDWASTFTTNGVPSSSPYTIIGGSQVPGFYISTTPTGGTAGTNNDFVGQEVPPGTVVSSIANCYTVRFNSTHAPYSTANPVQTGGILITPNMGNVNAVITSWRALNNVQIVQNNTNAVFVLGGVIQTGTGAIVKSGAGTWFFDPIAGNNLPMNYVDGNGTYQVNGPNYYNYAVNSATTLTSELFLNGGATIINSNTVLGQAASQGTTPGSPGTINLNGGTLMSDLINVSLINTAAGNANRPVFLGGNGGGLAAQANTTMTVSGIISNAVAYAGPLTIGVAGNLVPGTGGNTANPALYASGTVDLSAGANTYTGGTILQSGTVRINGINNLGGAGTYGGLTFNGGTLQYAPAAGGFGSLDLSSGYNGITLSSGGGTLDVNGNSVTAANSIGNYGGGALVVMSSAANGTLTLSGANTYTGNTTVTNVTLNVNNASGSATGTGNVTVQNNGTLSGGGSLAGSVTVNSGGTFAPGNPLGVLTVGNNLTLAAGSTTFLQVQHAPLTNDAVQIGGVMTAGGTLIVTNTGGTALAAGDSFQLFSAGSYSGSFASVTLPALAPELGWNTSSLNSVGLLSVISIVPQFNSVSVRGDNLVLQGTGGLPSGSYYVLGSTNLTLPLTNWTRLATNSYDANGNFNFTNVISPAMTQQFILLQLP